MGSERFRATAVQVALDLCIAGAGHHDGSRQDSAARDGDGVHRRAGIEYRLCARPKTTVPDVVPERSRPRSSASRSMARLWKATWRATPLTAMCSCSCLPVIAKERNRRYPVVYALHGYSIGAEQWSQEIHVPQTIEGAFAQGAKEMIVVLPDSKTVHNGSMYSSSVDHRRFREVHRARCGVLH